MRRLPLGIMDTLYVVTDGKWNIHDANPFEARNPLLVPTPDLILSHPRTRLAGLGNKAVSSLRSLLGTRRSASN